MFNVGDRVICVTSPMSGYGGEGWRAGRIFTIDRIIETRPRRCCFPRADSGVYETHLRLVSRTGGDMGDRYSIEDLDKWTSQDGTVKEIKQLELDHLLNIVAMLHRRQGRENVQRNKLVTLEKELVKRLTHA